MSAAKADTGTTTTISADEKRQVQRANKSGKQPVAFVHGLWLLPSSWDRWAKLFEKAGYVAVTVGWPDDPDTVADAKAHPEVFAGKSIREIADHVSAVVGGLDKQPAVIGHSFGGLLTEIAAGRGDAACSVPISPAPHRGVLPLPFSALRVASVAVKNPRNRERAVPLTYDQFRYGFGNVLEEKEAKELYATYSVPGPGKVLFQAAAANVNPWSQDKVDVKNPDRGPMLLIGADRDHTVPWAITNASYKRERHNKSVTEIEKFTGRGHSLTIDHGWKDVADKALAFVKRFA
jgi:non-heme chloroperoxidase